MTGIDVSSQDRLLDLSRIVFKVGHTFITRQVICDRLDSSDRHERSWDVLLL